MTEALLTLLAFWVAGALPAFILLRVMLDTITEMGLHHGVRRGHLLLPVLIWPFTVLVLGCWHPTDSHWWWGEVKR